MKLQLSGNHIKTDLVRIFQFPQIKHQTDHFAYVVLIITLIAFLSGCDPRYGFIENEHQLAPESRLPIWFKMPTNYSRADLTMTITTYSSPFGFKTRIIVYGPEPNHKVLMDKVGKERTHPLTTIPHGFDIYPFYSIITIDGTEEIFEQRRPEPFLYISDDPILIKGQDRGHNIIRFSN